MNAKEKDGWVWTVWSHVRHKNKRRMRVAENLSLGGKRSLVLVECDGRSFFVGCGSDAVNCILPMPFEGEGLTVARPWQAEEEAGE